MLVEMLLTQSVLVRSFKDVNLVYFAMSVSVFLHHADLVFAWVGLLKIEKPCLPPSY